MAKKKSNTLPLACDTFKQCYIKREQEVTRVSEEEKKFNIFVPIDVENFIKSNTEKSTEDWYVRGYASTPNKDLQGDIVLPEGLDIDYFKRFGWLNYEHKQDAEFVIGVPTENCYVDMQKGLFLEAKLFKNNRYAQQIWELANSLSKSKTNRNLGFSIEGSIRRRNEADTRVIEDLMIRNVAITKSPANTYATWESFTKSWLTGTSINPSEQDSAGVLRREQFGSSPDIDSLGGAITRIAQVYAKMTETEMDDMWKGVSEKLDSDDMTTPEVATVLLQVSKGLSREEAQNYVEEILSR